jgi:hypothetical protein
MAKNYMNCVYKFSSYCTVNALHLDYKSRPVNSVRRVGRFLFAVSYEAKESIAWAEYRIFE